MSKETISQLNALGMDIDPTKVEKMSSTERLEAVQKYLSNGGSYYEQQKDTIDKIAARAFQPLRKTYEKTQKRIKAKENATSAGEKALKGAKFAKAIAPSAVAGAGLGLLALGPLGLGVGLVGGLTYKAIKTIYKT